MRAEIVVDLADWRWSSYRAMTRQADVPTWLETDALLAHLAHAAPAR